MATLKEILESARVKLLADTAFAALIGPDVGADAAGKVYDDGWVFKSIDDANSPLRNPQNTGKAAVVLSMYQPWTNPNMHNTARFRLLEVDLWCDSTRSIDPKLTYIHDAEERCDRIATAVFNVFHDAANKNHWWPNDVYIVSSVAWNEINMNYVPDTDGLVHGNLSFALVLQ